MSTIKVILTCQIPGVLKENRSIITQSFLSKEGLSKRKIMLENLEKQKAFKVLNISEQAYNFMVSKKNPNEVRLRDWLRMSEMQRLNHHLKILSEGNPFSYKILN